MDMGPKWVRLGVMMILLEGLLCETERCWERERIALMRLSSVGNCATALNWVELDCCQWKGVECNSTTGRVEKLSLGCACAVDHCFLMRSYSDRQWCSLQLNASLFLPFQQLKSLNLSCLGIYGWVYETEGPETASTTLSNLEVLDLSSNFLGRSVLSSLAGFSSLKYLNLGGNAARQGEPLNFSDFERLSMKLRHLEVLDLSFAEFVPGKLSSLSGFSSLKSLSLNWIWFASKELWQVSDLPYFKNLEHLSLDGLPVSSASLPTTGAMASLKTLSLHGCQLSGTLPAQGACEFLHIQVQDISQNYLNGTLPLCLSNLTWLHLLDLSHNRVQIPSSFKPFYNLSKLKYLDVDNNEIYTESESNSLTPKFQLEILSMSAHGHGGTFPNFVYHQHDLRSLVISNIKMEGAFPNWLLENNIKLERLSLVNLSLSGSLQLPIHSHMQLAHLDLSENRLFGKIPTEIGAYFPNLEYLNISSNGLSGTIPFSIVEMNLLQILDLSNNQLSGRLPEQCCSLLHTLVLSNNSFEGQILFAKSNWRNMSWLQLDDNHFTGRIPDGLYNSSFLEVLDISDNQLSGKIPGWIGNMLYLEALDLSRNNLSGSLPTGFCPPGVFHVHLSKNGLQGSLDDAFLNCSLLTTLDLSHNHFSGNISSWLSSLYNQLNYLILKNNSLDGEIPIQFCNFDEMWIIDLSHNRISGQIFPCLNQHRLDDAAPAPAPILVSSEIVSPVSPQEPLQFTAKSRTENYRGTILEYMSGIDLSCNRLTGEIPPGIGTLIQIRSLNISHNSLSGSIPATLSHLNQIESLDLSNNNLDGTIPSQLTQLYTLAVFNVSYNNLHGNTPQRICQFATFDESSYFGNPLLCGVPLPNNCTPPEALPGYNEEEKEEDSGLMDMEVFYVTFVVTYTCVLLGLVAVLYINPRWRRIWFYLISSATENCYYFIVDNILKFRIM